MDKGLVFNHCQKSLQNHALNDIGHQRKQIITASDWVTICAGHNPLVLRDTRLQVNAVKLQLCNHKELWVHNAKLFKQPISSNYVHAACIFNTGPNKFVLVTDTGCSEKVRWFITQIIGRKKKAPEGTSRGRWRHDVLTSAHPWTACWETALLQPEFH